VSPDPALDDFRQGVAALFQGGVCVAHVATLVEAMRTPFRRKERVWLLLTHLDGSRERIKEDYPPWTYVSELQQGRLVWEAGGPDGTTVYDASWLEGDAREPAWELWGIKSDVSSYL
jgi:hypothetical protein